MKMYFVVVHYTHIGNWYLPATCKEFLATSREIAAREAMAFFPEHHRQILGPRIGRRLEEGREDVSEGFSGPSSAWISWRPLEVVSK